MSHVLNVDLQISHSKNLLHKETNEILTAAIR